MGWQEISVAIIVAAALAFLLRRLVGRRRASKSAQSFVPLSSLRKPPTPQRDTDPPCH